MQEQCSVVRGDTRRVSFCYSRYKTEEDSTEGLKTYRILNWSFSSVRRCRCGSWLRDLLFIVHARALSRLALRAALDEVQPTDLGHCSGPTASILPSSLCAEEAGLRGPPDDAPSGPLFNQRRWPSGAGTRQLTARPRRGRTGARAGLTRLGLLSDRAGAASRSADPTRTLRRRCRLGVIAHVHRPSRDGVRCHSSAASAASRSSARRYPSCAIAFSPRSASCQARSARAHSSSATNHASLRSGNVPGALGVGAMRGRGAGTQRASQRSTALRTRDARAVRGMLMASVDDSKSAMRRTKSRSRTRATRDAARTTAPIDHSRALFFRWPIWGRDSARRPHPVLRRATTGRRELSSGILPAALASGRPRGALRARLLGCRWRWRWRSASRAADCIPRSRRPPPSKALTNIASTSWPARQGRRARRGALGVDARDVHVGGAQPRGAAPRARRPGRRLHRQRRVETPPSRGRSSRRSSDPSVADMTGRTHDGQPSHCQQPAALVRQRPRSGRSSRSANS